METRPAKPGPRWSGCSVLVSQLNLLLHVWGSLVSPRPSQQKMRSQVPGLCNQEMWSLLEVSAFATAAGTVWAYQTKELAKPKG